MENKTSEDQKIKEALIEYGIKYSKQITDQPVEIQELMLKAYGLGYLQGAINEKYFLHGLLFKSNKED